MGEGPPRIGILDPDADLLVHELRRRDIPIATAATRADGLRDPGGIEILLASPRLAAPALPELASLRWIQSTWAGVEPLLAVGVPPRVVVTRAAGIFGPQMREYVFGHLLSAVQGHPRFRAAQRSHVWDPRPPGLLVGSTLGVLGTGSIGSALAETASAFGMRAIGCSRRGRPAPGFDTVFPVGRRLVFAAAADHLVAVLPATPETEGLVDAALLGALRPGAVLVNVGRGSTVDTTAVVAALRSGRLSRAVLDVFDREPLPEGDPLWDEPGLVVTPHVAAVTRPQDVVGLFADNLRRRAAGEEPVGLVDPGAGY